MSERDQKRGRLLGTHKSDGTCQGHGGTRLIRVEYSMVAISFRSYKTYKDFVPMDVLRVQLIVLINLMQGYTIKPGTGSGLDLGRHVAQESTGRTPWQP